jgi:beta-N-acetylhexosaminidase
MVYAFPGTTPPPDLVRRIRTGRAGAVILFSDNLPTVAAGRALVRRLQAIPRPAAVDEPLLVMTDQEGGAVRRLPGPPARSASSLGAAGPVASRAAGRAAGRLLRGVGITVDLAPVADVPRPGSFLAAEGRTFASAPSAVAADATAFAQGLADARVAAAAKHFPGIGAARRSTDLAPVSIRLGAGQVRGVDMAPFRSLLAARVPMVMLATASYRLDPGVPAALSRRIATGELRNRLGFTGVTITDALDTPALAPSGGTGAVAVRAAGAGSDLLLHTGYAAGTTSAAALAAALRAGRLDRARSEAAVARILALRASLR